MKFLVIRFSSLGDIIQTTAFVKKLKEIYPNGEIIYATKEEFKEILEEQPYIDRLIGLKKSESITNFAKRIGKVHCIFDLHKNLRSTALCNILNPACIKRVNKNTIYRYALVLKLKSITKIFERESRDNIQEQLKLINQENSQAKPYIKVKKSKTDKTVIGIAPGAKWHTKMWPKEYYREVAKMLTEKGFYVYIFGSKEEEQVANFIAEGLDRVESFAGKLSIKETAEKMTACKVFISNDSALMHLANALNIPTVAIFGPTVKGFGFYPKRDVIVLEKDLPCRPCSLHGSDRCPNGTLKCLKEIKPEEVYNAVMQWLN
ncbi:glycosyltransferase family 9 protein [Hippea alviniae]|uniref:glycosyltransferase family 9 protein n=1 Tax=Hippea alviniae TaxID=1279027 RepID=UPI0003B3DAAE|nr:glycosyltransferase family 9 protein [Hippea alviniae]